MEGEMRITIAGVSTFFLFAIPLVLALAALYWLLFVSEARVFMRDVSQARRHAEIVGAKVLPRAPMEIDLRSDRDSVLKIDRAEIDGGDLWVYYRNTGQSRVDYIQIKWSLIAPDGTVLKSGGTYAEIQSLNDAPDSLEGGERGEAHYRIPSDPRAVTLRLRVHN